MPRKQRSSTNFRINDAGFAFKIGMNPAYSKFCPGFLVEYRLLEFWEEAGSRLRDVDSGSVAGSYLEDMWPGRTTMVSGHLVRGALPSACAALKQVYEHTLRPFSIAS